MADRAADPVAAYARKRAAIDQLAHAVSSWGVEDVEALAAAIAGAAALEAGDCPRCGAAIEREVESGPVVLAVPCGHQLRAAPRYRGRR